MADKTKEPTNIQPTADNQIVLYTTSDGKINLEVQIDNNTVWLSQQQICLLYGKAKSTISEHLTHIFEDGELDPQVVVRENRTTTQHGAIEGKTQENVTRFYNLDAILSVGFRLLRLCRKSRPRSYTHHHARLSRHARQYPHCRR